MIHRSIALVFVIGVGIAAPALITHADDATQSGTAIGMRSDSLAVRIDRMLALMRVPPAGGYGDLIINPKTVSAFQGAMARYGSDIRSLRLSCRERERKANRDTVSRVRNACYRDQLHAEKAHIHATAEFMAIVPHVDTATQKLFQDSAMKLREAEGKIIAAIDAGGLFSESQLTEMQQRLQNQFRAAYVASLRELQVQKQLSWVALTLGHLKQISQKENAPPDVTAALDESVTCLDGVIGELSAATSANITRVLGEFFPQCHKGLRRVVRTVRQWEEATGG